MANRYDLEGRRAVVTGAARGIGLAVVHRFLESGARVALWDRDGERLRRTFSELDAEDRALAFEVDMSNPAAVEAATTDVVHRWGGIDILVNNAGISGPAIPVADLPVETWREIVAIDLDGVFHGCKYVVPHMIEKGYGRIVNVASIAGKEGNPNAAAYSAAKAGVIALTKSLGKELAKYDIAVNCITPAAARTEILEQLTQEHIDYMLARIPRGRFVRVEEIASLVTWLSSEENSFTTGAVFDLSGGRATY